MAPLSKLRAPEVAGLLAEYGWRTALLGGNPYRARAYTRAAESLSALGEPIGRLIEEDRLKEIPGVGDAIADIVTKLHRDGTHPALERMRQEIPQGVLEMLSVPGLRPEQVLKLHRLLGVRSVEDLEQAARDDRIKATKGLGPSLQRKILQGLEVRRSGQGARHLHRAAELMSAAERNLKRSALGLRRITPAGEFRRGCEIVRKLELVAETDAPGDLADDLGNSELTLHLSDPDRFGATLLHATGSRDHLQQLAAVAKRKGFRLDKSGLYRGDKIVASRTEAEIYEALGLQFVEPELREGRTEIKLARSRRLPKLVCDTDLRGILHAHTDASDGGNTLEQMSEAVRKRGYSYFGVADHSKSAHYAGGLSVEAILEQHERIDHLNSKYGRDFRIFKGIESDILPDGSLDYPDDVLRRFDFIVASVHGQFRMDRKAQTERLLRAVANPFVTILGHMSGRQLLRRPGYDVDLEQVLRACAKYDVAVEINANPWRLDLDWRWHQKALELGCLMSINPDAHSIAEIDLTHWGVLMARKGGVPPAKVLNTKPLKSFAAWLKRRQ